MVVRRQRVKDKPFLNLLLLSMTVCFLPGADKSLARPGRKQAQKYFRDARGFNNIETRAVINFFFSAMQGAEGN